MPLPRYGRLPGKLLGSRTEIVSQDSSCLNWALPVFRTRSLSFALLRGEGTSRSTGRHFDRKFPLRAGHVRCRPGCGSGVRPEGKRKGQTQPNDESDEEFASQGRRDRAGQHGCDGNQLPAFFFTATSSHLQWLSRISNHSIRKRGAISRAETWVQQMDSRSPTHFHLNSLTPHPTTPGICGEKWADPKSPTRKRQTPRACDLLPQRDIIFHK